MYDPSHSYGLYEKERKNWISNAGVFILLNHSTIDNMWHKVNYNESKDSLI